jgi:hypothetical protein
MEAVEAIRCISNSCFSLEQNQSPIVTSNAHVAGDSEITEHVVDV